MRSNAVSKNPLTIRQVIEKAASSGQITYQDYLKLTSALLSQPNMRDEERTLINRVFDAVRAGQLKLVDEFRSLAQ
jgi:hypothetical protein